MADVFLACSRSDRNRAAAVVEGLEAGGRSVWWDRKPEGCANDAAATAREIAAARCVLVAWSASAQRSLWVRAAANEALDQNKLIQVRLDGADLPMPFGMLPLADLSKWDGMTTTEPWPELEERVAGLAGDHSPPVERRDVVLIERGETPLQGLGRVAALGWAAWGVAIVLALAVLLVVRGQLGSSAFAIVSILSMALSVLLLSASGFVLTRVITASRR